MNTILKSRCQALQDEISEQKIEALLISSPENITYLTGVYPISHYEREAFILVTPKKFNLFYSQFRQSDFGQLNLFDLHVLDSHHRLSSYLTDILDSKQIWFESEDLSWKEYDFFQSVLNVKMLPISNLIENLRLIKDSLEIENIKKASNITAQAWANIQKLVKPRVTEKFLAWKLMEQMNQLGSDGVPYGFEPIVAFASHTASPHHTPTDTKLKKEDVLLVDFGACTNGYASDFTRTLLIGDVSDKVRQTFALVQDAYMAGLLTMKKKVAVSEIDLKVFEVFDKAKKGDLFIHTSGHGIGLSVHEAPSIYRTTSKDLKLKSGLVLTLEPGLYYPNEFGIRHENTILITNDGLEELTVLN